MCVQGCRSRSMQSVALERTANMTDTQIVTSVLATKVCDLFISQSINNFLRTTIRTSPGFVEAVRQGCVSDVTLTGDSRVSNYGMIFFPVSYLFLMHVVVSRRRNREYLCWCHHTTRSCLCWRHQSIDNEYFQRCHTSSSTSWGWNWKTRRFCNLALPTRCTSLHHAIAHSTTIDFSFWLNED